MKIVHKKEVFGAIIDEETRCKHYHTNEDIIAIKFYCCQKYYPCIQCHTEVADHKVQLWPKAKHEYKAILCGHCGYDLSIPEYMNSSFECPNCHSQFNSGCKNHYHLYFELE